MKRALALVLVVIGISSLCFAAPEDMIYRPRAVEPIPVACSQN